MNTGAAFVVSADLAVAPVFMHVAWVIRAPVRRVSVRELCARVALVECDTFWRGAPGPSVALPIPDLDLPRPFWDAYHLYYLELQQMHYDRRRGYGYESAQLLAKTMSLIATGYHETFAPDEWDYFEARLYAAYLGAPILQGLPGGAHGRA